MTTMSRPQPSTPDEPQDRGNKLREIVVWSAVAVVGAVCWGVIALARDEQISAIWLLGAALGSYAIAYRFYAKFIMRKVLEVDDTRATPA